MSKRREAVNGAHPFDCLHLKEHGVHWATVRGVAEALHGNLCPRCLNPLPPEPYGSLLTDCKCVPLCDACVSDEAEKAPVPEDTNSWPIRRTTGETRSAWARPDASVRSAPMGTPLPATSDEMKGWEKYGTVSREPKRRQTSSADCALDALAVLQTLRDSHSAAAMESLWESIDEPERMKVTQVLAGWLVTMNQLTAVNLTDWEASVRRAALAMKAKESGS